jgi:beta-galactosidase
MANIFVTVSVVDKMEFLAYNNQLKFKVTGAGTYRAACGDATSLEMFHKETMKLLAES